MTLTRVLIFHLNQLLNKEISLGFKEMFAITPITSLALGLSYKLSAYSKGRNSLLLLLKSLGPVLYEPTRIICDCELKIM